LNDKHFLYGISWLKSLGFKLYVQKSEKVEISRKPLGSTNIKTPLFQ
jgi:hypothetical protein